MAVNSRKSRQVNKTCSVRYFFSIGIKRISESDRRSDFFLHTIMCRWCTKTGGIRTRCYGDRNVFGNAWWGSRDIIHCTSFLW